MCKLYIENIRSYNSNRISEILRMLRVLFTFAAKNRGTVTNNLRIVSFLQRNCILLNYLKIKLQIPGCILLTYMCMYVYVRFSW